MTTPRTASNSEARKRLAEQNGTHTKHHDPAVVQLIEQARAEGAAEVVARVEALHVPVPALAYGDDCLSPDTHEWMEADDGTALCCDCPNDGLRVCGECRDDSGGLYVDWPCQTAAALRGDA